MRRKVLFPIIFIIITLLISACSNGNNGGLYDEKNDDEDGISIHVVLDTFSEKAYCNIFAGDDSGEYNDAVIMINNQKLEFTPGLESGSRFYLESNDLKLAQGEEVNIKINHPLLGFIEEELIVAGCPSEITADVPLEDYLAGTYNRIKLSWDDIGCDEYCIEMIKTTKDDPYPYTFTSWETGSKKYFYEEDSYVMYISDDVEKHEKAETLTFFLYGTSSKIFDTSFGRVLLRVKSPTRLYISTEENPGVEKVYIFMTFDTGNGTVNCYFSKAEKGFSAKYNDAVILVNGVKLDLREDGSFVIDDENLKAEIGDEVVIEINHPLLRLIEETLIVPDCPESIYTDPSVDNFLSGNVESISMYWDKIDCDGCYVEMLLEDKLRIGRNSSNNSVNFYNEDLYIEDKGEMKKTESVIFQIYGRNMKNYRTLFGSISLEVYSPTYTSVSAGE